MSHALYSTVLRLGLLGYLPVAVARHARGTGHPPNVASRLWRAGEALPPAPRCWVHAVSVGEALTAAPLVDGLRARWPALAIVMTTVTPTGASVVGQRLGDRVTHRYFPLDLPRPVARALDAVRPRFFIAMETELWPNFLRALAQRGVPAMVANGRISDRSFRRYQRVRPFMRRVLRAIAVFAMQSEEDARRIVDLGAPPARVVVTGSLKSDVPPPAPGAAERWAKVLGLEPGEALWVAGSTHRGEESPVLDAYLRARAAHPRLVLLMAPRHPERVEEVEALVAARGLAPIRRSALAGARPDNGVVVLDTVGELADLYGAAALAFVGGSLVNTGGHNMLEPAVRGRPVLFGPHTSNFRESAQLLLDAGGALRVADGGGLAEAVGALAADPARRAAMGEAGARAVAARRGALEATLALVQAHLAPDA